ncbi:C40 family peptidase [Pseudarthrobacter sp. NPDC092439]|uniref:C40 family peptidase n=1 Tax=unclassified Pseudarthrobacter TaxID=2647000 RepID=UPI00381B2526
MPMVEALGRMQEIRTALTRMSELTPPVQQLPASAGTAPGRPADPAKFGQALEALTASMPGIVAPGAPGLGPAPAAPAPGAGKIGETAAKYAGLPYIWGGNDPAVGLDCSSFVQNVYRDLGYELPRVTWDQMKEGTAVPSMAQAKPGDLLFSFNGGHVALYLGNGKAIDAPQPGKTIQVRDAWENDANVTAIRRILPAGDAGARSPLMAGALR